MQVKNYEKSYKALLLILSLGLVLQGCSTLRPEPKVITQIQTVERTIPIQARPKGLNLNQLYFYAVTEENFEEFKEKFVKDNGDFVFFAISVPGYENLSLNMAELRRFIEQQTALIVYYEKQAVPVSEQSRTEELRERLQDDGS